VRAASERASERASEKKKRKKRKRRREEGAFLWQRVCAGRLPKTVCDN